MKVLGLDFEATGLDTNTDRPVEVGVCLWETDTNKPLLMFSTMIYDRAIGQKFTPEVSKMLRDICDISEEELVAYGVHPKEAMQKVVDII